MRTHHYDVDVSWTGGATTGYRDYSRDFDVESAATTALGGSADPHFRGDAQRWNPEQLLVAAASSCHMLSYLAHCARAGVVVVDYSDAAEAIMAENKAGGGRFTSITLHPRVTITAQSDAQLAADLHAVASRDCFIAATLTISVAHEPTLIIR